MSDSDLENQGNAENRLYEAKQVEFYAALVEAWINTRMERDKQILALSSLALGGLVAYGLDLPNVLTFSMWIGAGGSFVISIFLALVILSLNATYIEKTIAGNNESNSQSCLHTLDKILMAMFFIGVLLTFALAIVKSNFVVVKLVT